MSAQSIASFRAKVTASSDLQTSLTAALKGGSDAVIALGKENGCDFTVADIAQTAKSSDLTDFELGLVSGGRGMWNPMFPEIAPDK